MIFDNTAPNKHWYAGITTRNPDVRKKEHENKKNIICEHFKTLHKTDEEVARIIEKKLETLGFSIGKDIYRYRTDWEPIKYFETKFAYDLSTTSLGCGGTVVFPALQFALWTHPKRIYLVGCDTNTAGYFDATHDNNYLIPAQLKQQYKKFKSFAEQYYPDVEIISINPIGLIGIFKDEYQE